MEYDRTVEVALSETAWEAVEAEAARLGISVTDVLHRATAAWLSDIADSRILGTVVG